MEELEMRELDEGIRAIQALFRSPEFWGEQEEGDSKLADAPSHTNSDRLRCG